ncbi:MAG: hypothetical protein PGMFKBFP_02871 [Anaerolineales bacterium]|nr:hypothetical protein [Anaerolineales bacterium]
MVFLRHGDERGVHQVPVAVSRERPAARHPVRAVLHLVAGAFGRGAGGDRGGTRQHARAQVGLRAVRVEHRHPCLHSNPRFLPGLPSRVQRLSTQRLFAPARPGVERVRADAGTADLCRFDVRLGQGTSLVRRRVRRTARTRSRGLRGRTDDLRVGTLPVPPRGVQRESPVPGALRLGRGQDQLPLWRVRNARLGGVVVRTGGGDRHHADAADQLHRDLGELGHGAEFHLRLQRDADIERRGHARHLRSDLERQKDSQSVLQRDGLQIQRPDQRLHRRGAAGGGAEIHPRLHGRGVPARRALRHPAHNLGRVPIPLVGGR